MKKVAFICWDMTILGGINQVAVTLANEFSKSYEVSIISLIKGNGQATPILDSCVKGIQYIQDSDCRGRDVLLKGRKKLNQYLEENDIDILFLMGFQVAPPVITMVGTRKCKMVFCDHEALMSRWHEKKITLVRYFSAIFSHKVITLTEKNALDYRKHFRLPVSKVDYIYNSIDEKIVANANKSYDEKSKTILSVGRLSPEKGYDMLIDIAEEILNKHSDWKWFIYGDGELFSELKNEIERRKMSERLFLKGATKNVSEIYKQGAIFVLTSRREGLPLVLLEAKVNSLPCVSFDIVSGPSEIIRNKIDGFLIEPFDKEKMIESIDELIVNESKRVEMAFEAKTNLDKFEMKQIMKQWKELINSL